jgi:hypothetical protein
MERAGIVKKVSGLKRDRVYCAQKLLDIFEEPAHLTPFIPAVRRTTRGGTRKQATVH